MLLKFYERLNWLKMGIIARRTVTRSDAEKVLQAITHPENVEGYEPEQADNEKDKTSCQDNTQATGATRKSG